MRSWRRVCWPGLAPVLVSAGLAAAGCSTTAASELGGPSTIAPGQQSSPADPDGAAQGAQAPAILVSPTPSGSAGSAAAGSGGVPPGTPRAGSARERRPLAGRVIGIDP